MLILPLCSIYRHGGHDGWLTGSSDITFKGNPLRMIQATFGLNWPSGFRGEDFWKSLQTDDGRQVMAIAHTGVGRSWQAEHVCNLNLTPISYSFWNTRRKVLRFKKKNDEKRVITPWWVIRFTSKLQVRWILLCWSFLTHFRFLFLLTVFELLPKNLQFYHMFYL